MTGARAFAAPVVEVADAWKGYRRYARPLDRLKEAFLRRPLHEVHWAVEGVDLTVQPGETVGIIGENGAGKSTLLKMVAGTIRPTRGTVQVRGRTAALLELGAAFHPEEKGSENVRLAGVLAGVSREELPRFYERVVGFAELPREALARPVNTYSSGMLVRLAFSAATTVDPDLLIIDEALSVGDMHFQKKSLDRIMALREAGKTILFCSHNLYQVRSLCTRAAWLHDGGMRLLGPTEKVVTAYESYQRERDAAEPETPVAAEPAPAGSQSPVRLQEVDIVDADGVSQRELTSFQPVEFVFRLAADRPGVPFHVGMAVVRNDRENIFGTSTHFAEGAEPLVSGTHNEVRLRIPELHLLSGEYLVSAYLLDDTGLQVLDLAELACPFRIHNPRREFGIAYMPHHWER